MYSVCEMNEQNQAQNFSALIWRPYNVFHQLWSVTPNRLDSLENVDFTMLNDLLDASVGSAVDSASRLAITVKADLIKLKLVESLPV